MILDLLFFQLLRIFSGIDHEISQVSGKDHQKHNAIQEGDAAVQTLNQQQDADCQHEGDVHTNGGLGNCHRGNYRSQAENNQNIQNIAAHNIADGDFCAALQGRRNTDSSFRSTGAHSHNGQSDNQLGNLELIGNARRTVHEPIGSLYQQHKPQSQHQ